MKRQSIIVSIFLHALLLIGVYVLQGVILPFMRINGIVPLLLPVACTGVALYEGRITGGISGLFAGILCDISFNQPVGVFTVFLTMTGLFVGTLADAYILRGLVTYYISITAVLILSAFVQIFPLLVSTIYVVHAQEVISITIQQTIYSLVFALPIWFFVRGLGNRADRVSSSGKMY